MTVFDVIIPVKARPSVVLCIQSLLSSKWINRILVCDAGSASGGSEALAQLNEVSLHNVENVDVFHFPMSGFNKAKLINNGLLAATAEFVLISDADILWNQETLEALHSKTVSQHQTICCVADVQESNSNTLALSRDRYTYSITHDSHITQLKIEPVRELGPSKRPGCGLLYAQRATLLSLGGYKEFFRGWGWEDQDLLIRAQLLGIEVTSAGEVIHLSHDDHHRNQFHHSLSPGDTRNYNILIAAAALAQHQFRGNLATLDYPFLEPQNLQIDLPYALRKWLDEQISKGIADHPLSAARNTLKDTIGMVETSERQ
ncbi:MULTISPECIES: galactosyltransferase-related protein [unclassified Leptolyngbya]|uniref:glycosyltransferase family 2 protein n=1 Tax=unclassified Leptolyngbya TaxID=2650499 RepID=UPI00168223A0|nr:MULTISPECIES: galactosyltransferase-related protein [unclassified Leptolyngbya]MBD1909057.1 glycosyltransferase [Leptolyngbya sp. FACHB-8]MBD2157438.1 glycosyltransferase [Leptolyngbya sp. FACHB-16]